LATFEPVEHDVFVTESEVKYPEPGYFGGVHVAEAEAIGLAEAPAATVRATMTLSRALGM
jgi:hypothetical protein